MSDWTCGRCGTRVLSGLSHACHCSTGGNINYSEQVELEGRLMAENQRLREELRLTTAELHAAGDHLVRLDDEVTRLRAELREDGIEHLTADAASWRRHAENCEADLDRLRAAIEKLRDEVGASPLRSSFVALRIAEILERES